MANLFDELFLDLSPGAVDSEDFGASLLSSFPSLKTQDCDSACMEFVSPAESLDTDIYFNSLVLDDYSTDLLSSSDTSVSTTDSGKSSPSITDSYMSEENDVSEDATCPKITSLICGFQSCCFDATDWDTMVLHRQQKHSRLGASTGRYSCSICGQVFVRKHVRDRHVRHQHSRTPFYCPDCLNLAPLRRKDNYNRHRKTRHSETSTSITPPRTSPPSGHQRSKNKCLDFIPFTM